MSEPSRFDVRRLVGRARRIVGDSTVAATDPSVISTLDDRERARLERCLPFTMAAPERIVATMDSVAHVVRRDVGGALVECGVWRGGSVLAMILTLQDLGVDDREIFLFDTFSGMTEPTEADTSGFDVSAVQAFAQARSAGQRAWHHLFGPEAFGRAQVEALLETTGYPLERIHLVEGAVEDTIPDRAPDHLALLRLDTDFYESTKHEMTHLYPRLALGGVLLIDDYGHWDGARRAVDEHFAATGAPLLLSRTDYTGRLAIKH